MLSGANIISKLDLVRADTWGHSGYTYGNTLRGEGQAQGSLEYAKSGKWSRQRGATTGEVRGAFALLCDVDLVIWLSNREVFLGYKKVCCSL